MVENKKTDKSPKAEGIPEQAAKGSTGDGVPPIYRAFWPKWICYSEIELEGAVALSCDVDPEALRNPEGFGFGGHADDDPDETPDADFRLWSDRNAIARSQAGAGFKVVKWVPTRDGAKIPYVRMATFAKWAVRMGKRSSVWEKLPPAFEQLASEEPAPAWPWGKHHTELLDHLKAAAALWKNYESSSPATAPTRDDVIAFLLARKLRDGRKFPKRVAEVMAQILRADDLKDGPHNNE